MEINTNARDNMIPCRLISGDAVCRIICRYENTRKQNNMIYAINNLPGVLATPEQYEQLVGDDEIRMED